MVASIRLNPYGVLVLCLVGFFGFLYWLEGDNFGGHGDISFLQGQAVSVRQLLAVSIQLARRGGDAILATTEKVILSEKGGTRVKPVKLLDKDTGGQMAQKLLTEADVQSHQAIVNGFARVFPGLTVLSEERESQPIDLHTLPAPNTTLAEVEKLLPKGDLFVSSRDITVWVDPLDATKEFTEELFTYVSVLICVAFRGRPVVGVIHQPYHNKTYWAWKTFGMSHTMTELLLQGKQSTNRGRGGSTVKQGGDRPLVVTVSMSHAEADLADHIRKTLGSNVSVVPAGGSGYKVLSLLGGEADIYYHPTGISRWDICAPNALLDVGGGVMTTLRGQPISYAANDPAFLTGGLLASRKRAEQASLVTKLSEISGL